MGLPGNIIEVEVSDSINQLTPTCRITYALRGEFELANASVYLLKGEDSVGDAIPKINDRVSVTSTYNGTEIQIFDGFVTFSDDFEDAEKQTATVTLNQTPPDEKHLQGITSVSSSPNFSGELISSHEFLRSCANVAKIGLSNIGIPEYKLYGTIEYEGNSLLEIINEFIAPFNYPYRPFYVRYENGALVVNEMMYPNTPIALNGTLSKTVTFERYSTGKRINTVNIMCKGGDLYNYTEDSREKRDRDNAQVRTRDYEFDETFIDSTSSDNDTGFAPGLHINTYVTSVRDVHFKVRLTKKGVGDFPNTVSNLGNLQFMLATGEIDAVQILESYPTFTRVEQRKTGNVINGLESRTQTFYTYKTMEFGGKFTNSGLEPKDCNTGEKVKSSPETKTVLIATESFTSRFPNNQELLYKKTNTWYLYTDLGTTDKTIKKEYVWFRDQWVSTGTDVDFGGWQDYLTTLIGVYGAIKAGSFRGPESPETNQIASKNMPKIEEYRTLNGTPVVTEDLKNDADCNTEAPSSKVTPPVGYQITVPYAGYDGLKYAYQRIKAHAEFERPDKYWIVTNLVTVFNPSVFVGFAGIESVTHVLTARTATTTVLSKALK